MVDVSVVVGSIESEQSIRGSLESIRRAVSGIDAEIIVVDASRDRSADIAEELVGPSSVIRCRVGTLTPELWAEGIRRSSGRVVATTTGHFVVPAAWAHELIAGVEQGADGVAGTFSLTPRTSVTDWAIFYLRYSEFLVEPSSERHELLNIPADNAAYEGEALRHYVNMTRAGFWEVEFHRRRRAMGGIFALVPRATALYDRSFRFTTIATHRFHHGRHAAAWRLATGQRPRWLLVASSPLVPFALTSRVWRRVRGLGDHRRRFLRALPRFIALACAWAMGEAVGAIAGAGAGHSATAVPA